MGERAINPILNVHEEYRKVNIINSYWAVPTDPLVNKFTPTTNQLWSNPANWSKGALPTATETATIDGGNITLDVTTTINKLVVVTGYTLSADNSNRILTVNDIVTLSGVINFTGANANLILKGEGNTIPKANYIPGTTSTLTYAKSGTQTILDLNYNHLTVEQTGTKTPVANVGVAGNLDVTNSSVFQLATFNLTVFGNTGVGSNLSKSGAGAIVFTGQVLYSYCTVNFSGNPTVEYKFDVYFNNPAFTSGTGTVICSTKANLLLTTSVGGTYTFNGPVLVKGGITTTLRTNMIVNHSINGDSASSKFVTEGGILTFKNATMPMVTGIFDHLTNPGTIIYEITGDHALPYTSYRNLTISGTGNKTLSGHTTVNGALVNTSITDLGANNLTVSGTSNNGLGGTFRKTGAGTVIFNWNVNIGSCALDFSGGNPNIEFKGDLNVFNNGSVNFGSGQLKFNLSANKVINLYGGSGNQTLTVANPLLISGAFALSVQAGVTLILAQAINGDNAASALTNLGTLEFQNATSPMAIGLLNTNTGVNTVKYNLNGNQDVKAGTYRNLSLLTGGVKKLLGNVSVVNTYTLTAPATLDANTFALTNP